MFFFCCVSSSSPHHRFPSSPLSDSTQEIKSLFNAMVPTLVELLGAALDKAAAEAAAEGGEDEE